MNLLNNVKSGDIATIDAINAVTAGQSLYQRLIALGFRIGKQVKVIRRASFSGPLHVRIGSTDIVLRESEAKLIQISH